MSALDTATPPEVLEEDSAGNRIFTVGTLRYSKRGLWKLFSWLMWNDLCLMLMEKVAPVLVPFLLHDNGASNRQISFYTGTLVGLFTIWINPVVSTWSDRFRSRAGRRRPFLLFATPFCALFLAGIPFAPDVFNHLKGFASFGHFVKAHPSFDVVSFIALGYLFYAIFNSVILAIFTYYFWDVVPKSVLGRFSAMTNVVSTIAGFAWSFFIFGRTENHAKAVFVGVAVFFFVSYMVSLWRVKEGDYPPPAQEPTPGMWGVIVSYFRDCYRPYYLWFIIANVVFQIGNTSNNFQMFLFRYQLHMKLDVIGKMQAISSVLVIAIGYSMGSVVDRLKPGRVLIATIFFYAIANIGAFMFVNGPVSLLISSAIISLITLPLGISRSVFTVEFFPREKLGQFCSANAMMSGVTNMIVAPFVGMFFDVVKNYRYAYLWSTTFYLLSVPLFIKCYMNWRKVVSQPVVPLPVLEAQPC